VQNPCRLFRLCSAVDREKSGNAEQQKRRPESRRSEGCNSMSEPNTAEPREPDPFDVAALRLTQDFEAEVGVERALVRVPVRKPHRQEFVRTHPGESYRLDTALVELHEDREHFLVAPTLRAELFSEIIPKAYPSGSGTAHIW
jgi:hypothetical protein